MNRSNTKGKGRSQSKASAYLMKNTEIREKKGQIGNEKALFGKGGNSKRLQMHTVRERFWGGGGKSGPGTTAQHP